MIITNINHSITIGSIFSFHTTSTAFQDINHPLYREIDWAEVEGGMYAIVDPENKSEILYVSRTQYVKLLAVYRSTEGSVHLLAAAKSKRVADVPLHDQTPESPPLSQSLKGFLPAIVQGIGADVKFNGASSTVLLTEDNCLRVIQRYGKVLYHWATGKVPPKSVQDALYKFAYRMYIILKTQGYLAFAKRLKNDAVCVGHFLSGNPMVDRWMLGQSIGIKNGLPSDLPALFRVGLRRGDPKIIRFVFSLLFLYKGTTGKARAKVDFSPITDGYEGEGKVDFETVLGPSARILPLWFGSVEYNPEFEHSGQVLSPPAKEVDSYFGKGTNDVPFAGAIGLHDPGPEGYFGSKGKKASSVVEDEFPEEFPTAKYPTTGFDSLNQTDEEESQTSFLPSFSSGPNASVGGMGLIPDYHAFIHHFGRDLIPVFTRPHSKLKRVMEWVDEQYHKLSEEEKKTLCLDGVGPFTSHRGKAKLLNPDGSVVLRLGKLSTKDEAAGKVRVFAIVDQITQWLLKPLHDYLFEFLRRNKQDCTFNHAKGVEYLKALPGDYYLSLDLKSATDRIPIGIYTFILTRLFDEEYANGWTRLLVERDYMFLGEKYRYGTGQPMGAYSSWAMLAVAHHYLVAVAAQRVGWGGQLRFTSYQVLGDDIVIADRAVGESYKALLTELSIPFSPAKSFESNCGFFEFASNIVLREHNVSPVSLREVLGSVSIDSRLMLAQRTMLRWYCDEVNCASITVPLKLMCNHYQFKNWFEGLAVGMVRSYYSGLLCSYVLAPGSFWMNLQLDRLSKSKATQEEIGEFKNRSLKRWCALLAYCAFPGSVTGTPNILNNYFLTLEGSLYNFFIAGLKTLLQEAKQSIIDYCRGVSAINRALRYRAEWKQRWLDKNAKVILSFYFAQLENETMLDLSALQVWRWAYFSVLKCEDLIAHNLPLGYDFVVFAFKCLMSYTEPSDPRYKSTYRRVKPHRELTVISLIKATLFRRCFRALSVESYHSEMKTSLEGDRDYRANSPRKQKTVRRPRDKR